MGFVVEDPNSSEILSDICDSEITSFREILQYVTQTIPKPCSRGAAILPRRRQFTRPRVPLRSAARLCFRKGDGCHVWDADGQRYIDFCCSWGPLILELQPSGRAHGDRGRGGTGDILRRADATKENELASSFWKQPVHRDDPVRELPARKRWCRPSGWLVVSPPAPLSSSKDARSCRRGIGQSR